MKWIKCSERLPLIGEHCLFYNTLSRDIILMGYYSRHRTRWESLVGVIGSIDDSYVTHWMPLPDPPNQIDNTKDSDSPVTTNCYTRVLVDDSADEYKEFMIEQEDGTAVMFTRAKVYVKK